MFFQVAQNYQNKTFANNLNKVLHHQHLISFINFSTLTPPPPFRTLRMFDAAESSVLNQNQTWRANDMSNLTYNIQRQAIDSGGCASVYITVCAATIKLLKQTNLMCSEARQATEMRAAFTTIRCLNWMSKRQFTSVLLPPTRLEPYQIKSYFISRMVS